MTPNQPGSYRRPAPTLFDHIRQSLSIQGDDGGVPHVSDLPNDLISQGGKPYMRRHYLLGANSTTGGSAIRIHEILESDGQDLHDHPWDFVTTILSGSYVETTPDGEQEYGPGSVLVRKAEQLHRLTLPSGPVWTLIVLGPPRRRWGFQTSSGWQHWRKYLDAENAPASLGNALAMFD